MDFKIEEICQSCGMPLSPEMYGTDENGEVNKDYCKFCYQNGKFTSDMTLEEMIDFCTPKTAEALNITEGEARSMSENLFPKLKRWKK